MTIINTASFHLSKCTTMKCMVFRIVLIIPNDFLIKRIFAPSVINAIAVLVPKRYNSSLQEETPPAELSQIKFDYVCLPGEELLGNEKG